MTYAAVVDQHHTFYIVDIAWVSHPMTIKITASARNAVAISFLLFDYRAVASLDATVSGGFVKSHSCYKEFDNLGHGKSIGCA